MPFCVAFVLNKMIGALVREVICSCWVFNFSRCFHQILHFKLCSQLFSFDFWSSPKRKWNKFMYSFFVALSYQPHHGLPWARKQIVNRKIYMLFKENQNVFLLWFRMIAVSPFFRLVPELTSFHLHHIVFW